MKNIAALLFLIILTLAACDNDEGAFTPKPRAYPRVMYPENTTYQKFDENYCNFSFEHPSYVTIEQDKLFFDEKPVHPCWFDLNVKELNAKIHCCYYPIDKVNTFDKLITDASVLANKHTIKADYIDRLPFQKPNNVDGFVFDIKGNVASPLQFYLTDSTQHFMRGSIYINAKSQPDSLAPVYEFLKKDVMHLLNTFEWKQD